MKKIIFSVILAVWIVWVADVHAQMVIEATKVVRLHEEIGSKSPIPIVKSLDMEQHGKLLAFGGDDHIVRLWSVAERKFVSQLRGHRESVFGLTFSPDADRLATLGQDGQIHFWNVKDGSLLRTLNEPVRGTRQIAFQPDGSRFAVSGFDRNVRIYDSATYRLITTLATHDTNNETVAYSTDGSLLAVGGRTGVVRIWRTSDNKHLTDIDGDSRRVRAVAFSPDSSLLATGGEGPFIMLWNPQTGKLIRIFSERPGKTFSLTFCGNEFLASGESDNMVRLWDSSTGQNIATLSGHTGTISTMIYESTTQQLVTGSFDASVRFWTLPTVEKPIMPKEPVLLSAILPVTSEPAAQIAYSFVEESAPVKETPDFPEISLPTTTQTLETPNVPFGLPEDF